MRDKCRRPPLTPALSHGERDGRPRGSQQSEVRQDSLVGSRPGRYRRAAGAGPACGEDAASPIYWLLIPPPEVQCYFTVGLATAPPALWRAIGPSAPQQPIEELDLVALGAPQGRMQDAATKAMQRIASSRSRNAADGQAPPQPSFAGCEARFGGRSRPEGPTALASHLCVARSRRVGRWTRLRPRALMCSQVLVGATEPSFSTGCSQPAVGRC